LSHFFFFVASNFMEAEMNTKPSTQTSAPAGGIDWKIWVRFVIFMLLIPAILFLSAWTLNWLWGWIYTGLVIGTTIISRGLMIRANPDLAVERARSLQAEDAKSWDKVFSPMVAIYGPFVMWVVAGLDFRFELTAPLSLTTHLVALGVTVLAYAFSTWPMIMNRYFSGTVRIQEDRGHTVVSSGPYRLVRHPSYAGAIIGTLATPFMLGTLWAMIPAVLTAVAFVIRTALEDRTLQEELDGYREYARRVRYRLLPGIW
jgi:protein-S-isoprenylcysteine O-methyltransferase Ste14